MIALDAAAVASLRRELKARLLGASPDTLVSVDLELPPGREDWLEREPSASYRYWAVPAERDYRLGLGRALTLTAAGPERFATLKRAFGGLSAAWHREPESAASAFLGFSFDSASGSGMPCAEITVPSVLLLCRAGKRRAIFSCLARDACAAPDAWLSALARRPLRSGSRQWHRRVTPFADRMWLARVETALRDITAGRLEKVVLGRNAHLAAKEDFSPLAILSALSRRHEGSTVFAVGNGESSFLGLTPERLVSVSGQVVRADALAGTACSPDGTALLSNDKNRREHGLVVQAVAAALVPLCRGVAVPDSPHVLDVGRIRHLRSRIEGTLRPGVGLLDLVAALHPTPAVGGMPGPAALEWLRHHGEERGDWYSGGFGWLAPEGEGDVRVALRCASLSGRKARLYAGAGIVAGSLPEQELAETEAKFGPMLEAFEQYRGESSPLRAASPFSELLVA